MDFDTLYERYARDVYRFALYLSGREDIADDISAETFVRAWLAPQRIREGTVKAYLFAIARNLYRADRREEARVDALSDAWPSSGPSPEASAAARLDLARILARLQQLPEVDRAVLLMRAEDDMSYEEIAAAVGISSARRRLKCTGRACG